MYLFKFFSARNDETCLRCSGEYPRLVPRSERHVDVVAEEAVAGGGRVGGHDDGARLCKGVAVSLLTTSVYVSLNQLFNLYCGKIT